MTKQEIIAEFNRIIDEAEYDSIIPFLEAHKKGNVGTLKKALNTARRKYYKNDIYRRIKDNLKPQANVIILFALALLKPTDMSKKWSCIHACLIYKNFDFFGFYRQFYSRDLSLSQKFEKVILQIKPQKLEQLVAEHREDLYADFSYSTYRFFQENALMSPLPSVIATALGEFIRWSFSDDYSRNGTSQAHFDALIGTITNDKQIYQKDLLTLFEYEVDCEWLNNSDLNPEGVTNTFIYLIEQLIQQNKIDKRWVLEQCLAIQHKPWLVKNRSFFLEVFTALNPSKDDLSHFYHELLYLFSSDYAGAVKFATKHIKTLSADKDFCIASYLQALEPLMANVAMKSAISPIITHLNQLLKKRPEQAEMAIKTLVPLFACESAPLQEKTAKLVATYLKPQHAEAITLLNDYQDMMTAETKQSLSAFLDSDAEQVSEYLSYQQQTHHVAYLKPENTVTLWEERGDMLKALRAITTWRGIDFDIFFASWLKHKSAFRQESILLGSMRYVEFDCSDYVEQVSWALQYCTRRQERMIRTSIGRDDNDNHKLQLLTQLFVAFNNLECQDVDLPMLSTPTHLPCYVEPETLISRLLAYQNANIDFHFTDLGLALARMPRENIEPAVMRLEEINNPHLKALLSFALGTSELPDSLPPSEIRDSYPHDFNAWHGLWLTVARTHCPELQFNRGEEKTTFRPYEFDAFIPNRGVKHSLYESPIANSDIYSLLRGYGRSFSLTFDFTTPSCWTPLNQSYNDTFLCGHDDDKNSERETITFIEQMMSEAYPISDRSEHLLIYFLFSNHQSVRMAGVDALSYFVTNGRVDGAHLSEFFYLYLQHEIAPLKRALDSLTQLITYDSAQQSFALDMLSHTLAKLHYEEKLPTNFKKLLELYHQLLGALSQQPAPAVLENLPSFVELSKGLKPVVNKINKL